MLQRKSRSEPTFYLSHSSCTTMRTDFFAEIDTNLAPNNSSCISNSQYLFHNLEISQIQQHQDTEMTTSPSMMPTKRPLRAGIGSELQRTIMEAVRSIIGNRSGRLLARGNDADLGGSTRMTMWCRFKSGLSHKVWIYG